MKILEMHSWFRQYAQQMGMQNVRAILPEQIDLLINTSIEDTIDEIIGNNIGTTNDRIITDNAKLATVNALRTMYRNYTMELKEIKTLSKYDDGKLCFSFYSNTIPNYRYLVDTSVRYYTTDAVLRKVDAAPKTEAEARDDMKYAEDAKIDGYTILLTYANNDIDHLEVYTLNDDGTYTWEGEGAETDKYYVAGNDYYKYNGTNIIQVPSPNIKYTRWFPVRIIDDMYLADALNDFILAPRARSPILVTYGETARGSYGYKDNDFQKFDMYFGETSHEPMLNNLHLSDIRISYIKTPAKVKYLSDIDSSANVECDLPEQLQIPMLKHAVDLYRASIQGSLFANQEQNQQQQRENVRNQARPDNEGYKS